MSNEAKTSVFKWAQFVVGVFGVAAFLYVHAYVKELPVWLIGAPFILLGVDPGKFFGGKK